MVFKTIHTATGNVARSQIRSLVFNTPRHNSPYFRKSGYERQPLKKDVCLMCHVISNIQQNSKQDQHEDSSTSPGDERTILGLKTPCFEKSNSDSDNLPCQVENASEEEEKDEISDAVKENGKSPEEGTDEKQLVMSLNKDMSEILGACCMAGEKKDVLRQTVAEVTNHTYQQWIGPETEFANIKAVLNRIKCKSAGKDDSEEAHVYQLVYYVVIPGRSVTVVIPVCADDLKLLVHQSYAFFMDHEATTLTAHTYKDFDADQSLVSLPCMKWVDNIFNELLVYKNESGRASKMKRNNKRKKKGAKEGDAPVDAANEGEEPEKKKKKKKTKKLKIEGDENTEGSNDVEVDGNGDSAIKKEKSRDKKKKGKKGKIVSNDENAVDFN